MKQGAKPIQEKLILATIKLIENEEIDSITIRKIAKYANVNSAAINYYFGSKENLIEEALKATLSHSFSDAVEILEKENNNPYEAVQNIFTYFLEGGIKNPGITKAHLYKPIMHKEYQGVFQDWFDSILKLMEAKIKSSDIEKSEKEIKLAIIQIYSAILFSTILPDLFKNFGVNLKDLETQREYVDHFMRNFFDVNIKDLEIQKKHVDNFMRNFSYKK